MSALSESRNLRLWLAASGLRTKCWTHPRGHYARLYLKAGGFGFITIHDNGSIDADRARLSPELDAELLPIIRKRAARLRPRVTFHSAP